MTANPLPSDTCVAFPSGSVDPLMDVIAVRYPHVLTALLKDHTRSAGQQEQRNIFWATHDYEGLGPGYGYHDAIEPERIGGDRGRVVVTRVSKNSDIQTCRKREKAEIFTPAWIVNAQLNLVDEAWFGRPSPFNIEHPDSHSWTATTDPITFAGGKSWRDYVRAPRLEISCGEGPYLTSRYDAATGRPIALQQRVGILDRKLRVVSENVHQPSLWLKAAQAALKSVYGYEWQGDSLLIAREALLCSFIEAYRNQFGQDPQERSLKFAAYIIAWNVWQMDGLKGVVPDSCKNTKTSIADFFGFDALVTDTTCRGCREGGYLNHNGTYCLIRDWHARPLAGEQGPGRRRRFIDLFRP